MMHLMPWMVNSKNQLSNEWSSLKESVEPITLIALVAAAGFVFKKFSSQAKINNEPNREELSYSRDIVARSNIEKKPKEILPKIEILPEYTLIKKLVQKNMFGRGRKPLFSP